MKKKTLNIILVIISIITVVGVFAGISVGFNGSSSGSGGGLKGSSHECSWEIIDYGDATCLSGGTGVHKCTKCLKKETVALEALGHKFGDYGICSFCGFTETHSLLITKTELNDDHSVVLGECELSINDVVLLLFNQGKDNEQGYYLLYDDETDGSFSSDFEGELQLSYKNGNLSIIGSADHFIDRNVTVYKVNDDVNVICVKDSDLFLEFNFVINSDVEFSYNDITCFANVTTVTITPNAEFYDEIIEVGAYSVIVVDEESGEELSVGCFDSTNTSITFELPFNRCSVNIVI